MVVVQVGSAARHRPDIVGFQSEKSVIAGDVEGIHARAHHYDNKAEFLYTFLQVMTAAAASFTHGANDVANAVGPYATIYQIWDSGVIPKRAQVDLWILAFGGAGSSLASGHMAITLCATWAITSL
ncbi:Na+/Pi symporter [Metarhizium acridum]|nr:Na+/Pi symporter [Metarhizium acridum]